MAVLITRPEDDANDTARKVEALGLEAICVPVMKIELLPPERLQAGTLLIVTSKNAIRSISKSPSFDLVKSSPCVIAGRSTAQLAQDIGMSRVVLAGGTAETLPEAAKRAAETHAIEEAVYLHGEHVTHDVAAEVTAAGIPCTSHLCYRAAAAGHWELPDGAAKIDYVLHFSPRQAQLYLAIAHDAVAARSPRARHLCLAQRIANVLLKASTLTNGRIAETDIQIAAGPTQEELLALLPGGAAQSFVK